MTLAPLVDGAVIVHVEGEREGSRIEAVRALVDAGNARHQDTKHRFMQITIAERPSVTNQSLAP
ncbi:MAG: hypothetical protein A3G75_05245 [Verrucomicrobia bacterium RIFCSPLOWO2_12_FULL_64_8]|nr:MAG: hypothetical protein A3G75_05245 [Verrucomicrobia bacterium RIFCSPLOWO2_12_FULL_64_8]